MPIKSDRKMEFFTFITVLKSQNQTKCLKKHILLMCLTISFYIYFRSVRLHFVQKSPALLYSIVTHHVFKIKWEIFLN
jgi:hypothetical protein